MAKTKRENLSFFFGIKISSKFRILRIQKFSVFAEFRRRLLNSLCGSGNGGRKWRNKMRNLSFFFGIKISSKFKISVFAEFRKKVSRIRGIQNLLRNWPCFSVLIFFSSHFFQFPPFFSFRPNFPEFHT